MDIEIFTLCDAAADYHGRLNILGVFDTIFSSQVPARHPHCSIALRLRFEHIESGHHPLRLHIVDVDGKSVIPQIEGNFDVKIPDNATHASVNLVLNLGQLQFNHFGEYEIKLAIDNRQESSLPFWVRETPKIKE